MKKSIDLKIAIYALIIGLACALWRKITNPAIPDNISLGIGVILFVIAMVLTIVEVKKNLNFLYAFGENWRGDGLVNSGFILGIASFFLFTNHINGFLSAVVAACVMFLLRIGIRKTSHKSVNR